MSYHSRVLVTFICEAVLEDKIVETAKKHGVSGYTILEARGEGGRGSRSADFEYNKNIKLEILCKSETADKICDEVRETYFEDYAVVIYRNDVSVTRPDKFA